MQQALYRRIAVGVMGIAFLLKDYQIETMRGIAAAIYSLFFFGGKLTTGADSRRLSVVC